MHIVHLGRAPILFILDQTSSLPDTKRNNPSTPKTLQAIRNLKVHRQLHVLPRVPLALKAHQNKKAICSSQT
jgi:hypothetical protein